MGQTNTPHIPRNTWVQRPKITQYPPASIGALWTQHTSPWGKVPFWEDIISTRGDLPIAKVTEPVGISGELDPDIYGAAVAEITRAIRDKETIIVACDYDCDGQTAGAAMIVCLRECHPDVRWVVPNRLVHGYGLNVDLVKKISPQGGVVITVDNGIANVEETKQLIDAGYKVVITDHHVPDPGNLPHTPFIANPKLGKQPDTPEYMVPGVWVAAKVALAAIKPFVSGDLHGFLTHYCNCLVALGIVSDVIELHPAIRQQLIVGLADLSACSPENATGIWALLEMSGIKPTQPITTRDISFYVAPKLNAAGRMGKAELGIELLKIIRGGEPYITPVRRMAAELKELNTERKKIEEQIIEVAKLQAQRYPAQWSHSLVLYSPDWHKGVLGIVAAKIAEEFHRPTIVLSGGEELDGSGRSVEGLDLLGCLASCVDLLTTYGGHLAAAGLGLPLDQLDLFRAKFDQAVAAVGIPENVTYQYDAELTSISILKDIRTYFFLNRFEPFGPLVEPIKVRLTGLYCDRIDNRGRALYFRLVDDSGDMPDTLWCNQYGAPAKWEEQFLGVKVDVLIIPTYLYFRGTAMPEYRLVDIRLSETSSS